MRDSNSASLDDKNIFPFDINKQNIYSFRMILKNTKFKVLLGELGDFLRYRNEENVLFINVQELTSKHDTLKVTVTYGDPKSRVRKDNIFYLKFLSDKQSETEKLTQEVLKILKIPLIYVKLIKWKKNYNIYISEHYPNSTEFWELKSEFISEKDLILLQKKFAEILSIWYLYGKTDYLHNQLFTSENSKVFLVQMDHENKGNPLSDLTHPSGFDLDKIEKVWKNIEHRKMILNTLGKLKVGFRQSKGQKPSISFKNEFIKCMRRIVNQIIKDEKLKNLFLKKIEISSAYMYHQILVEVIGDEGNKKLFLEIFGEGALKLESLEHLKKQIRNDWKNYTNKKLMKQNKKKLSKGELKHKRKLEEKRLDLNSEFRNINKELVTLNSLLIEMNYPREKANQIITKITQQLNEAKAFWEEIITSEIIITLAENDVFKKYNN